MSQFYFSGRSRENRMHVVHDAGPSRADILAEVQQRRRRRELEQRHRNAAVVIQRAIRLWRARQDTLLRAVRVLQRFAQQVQSAQSSLASSSADDAAATQVNASLLAAIQQAAWCYGYVRRFAHLLPRFIVWCDPCVGSSSWDEAGRHVGLEQKVECPCSLGRANCIHDAPSSLPTRETMYGCANNTDTNNNNHSNALCAHMCEAGAESVAQCRASVVVRLTEVLTHAMRDLMACVSTAAVHRLLAALPRRGWLFMGQLLLQWYTLRPMEQRVRGNGAVEMLMLLGHTLRKCATAHVKSSAVQPEHENVSSVTSPAVAADDAAATSCMTHVSPHTSPLHWATVADELACMTLHFCHTRLAHDDAARLELIPFIDVLLCQGHLAALEAHWDSKGNHGSVPSSNEDNSCSSGREDGSNDAEMREEGNELPCGVCAMTHVYAPPWSEVCWSMMCAPSLATHLTLCDDALTTLLSVPSVPRPHRCGEAGHDIDVHKGNEEEDGEDGEEEEGDEQRMACRRYHHHRRPRPGDNTICTTAVIPRASGENTGNDPREDDSSNHWNNGIDPMTCTRKSNLPGVADTWRRCPSAGLVAAVVRVCYAQLSSASSSTPTWPTKRIGGGGGGGGHALACGVLVSFSILEKLVRLLPFFIHALQCTACSSASVCGTVEEDETCTSAAQRRAGRAHILSSVCDMRLLKQWLWCVAHLSRQLSHTSVFAESILYDLHHTTTRLDAEAAEAAEEEEEQEEEAKRAAVSSSPSRDSASRPPSRCPARHSCDDDTGPGGVTCGSNENSNHHTEDDANDCRRSARRCRCGRRGRYHYLVSHLFSEDGGGLELLMLLSAQCETTAAMSTSASSAQRRGRDKARTTDSSLSRVSHDGTRPPRGAVSASSVLEMACRVYAWPLFSFALTASSAYRRETAALFAKLLRHPQLLRRLWRLYRDRSPSLRRLLPVQPALRQLFARAADGAEEAVRLPPPPTTIGGGGGRSDAAVVRTHYPTTTTTTAAAAAAAIVYTNATEDENATAHVANDALGNAIRPVISTAASVLASSLPSAASVPSCCSLPLSRSAHANARVRRRNSTMTDATATGSNTCADYTTASHATRAHAAARHRLFVEPHPALAVLFFTLFGYYVDVTDLAEDLPRATVLSQEELWALVLVLKEVVHVAHMEGIAPHASGEAVAHAACTLLGKLYAVNASSAVVPYPALWISLTAVLPKSGHRNNTTSNSGGSGNRFKPATAAAAEELWSEVTRVRMEERRRCRRGRGDRRVRTRCNEESDRQDGSSGGEDECSSSSSSSGSDEQTSLASDEEFVNDTNSNETNRNNKESTNIINTNKEDAATAYCGSTSAIRGGTNACDERDGAAWLTHRRSVERCLCEKFPFLLARRRRATRTAATTAAWSSHELRSVLVPHGCRHRRKSSNCTATTTTTTTNDSSICNVEHDGNVWGECVASNECLLWEGSASWSPTSRMARVLLHAPFLVAFSARASLLTTLMLSNESETAYVPSEMNAYDVVVHRESVFEDAFAAFAGRPDTAAMRNVRFGDVGGRTEEGYGFGVYREFVVSVCQVGFAPEHGLFAQTPQCHVYPNAFSLEATGDGHHLHKISFLGSMVGRALRSGILQSSPFALHFCNTLLGRRNSVSELKRFDAQLYQHLHSLTRLTEEEVDSLGLTFTYTIHFLGVTREVELIHGGAAVPVSRSNCLHYIHLVADYKLNVEGALQTRAFRHGLKRTISAPTLQLFGSEELVKLFHGDQSGQMDVEDWQAHTVYSGEEDKASVTVRLFWEVVRSLSTEQQRRLLQFATSFNRPPLLGFRFLAPPFHIVVEASVPPDHLPSASTCFSLLRLPPYDSFETARAKIVSAIEGANTFECT